MLRRRCRVLGSRLLQEHPILRLRANFIAAELPAFVDEGDDIDVAVAQVIQDAPGVRGNLSQVFIMSSGTMRPRCGKSMSVSALRRISTTMGLALSGASLAM